MAKALFPGSFDPTTIGHLELVERASGLFEQIILGVGENSKKQCLFELEERVEMLRICFEGNQKVVVSSYAMLTAEYAREIGANYLLRGIRNASDLSYEQPIAFMNQRLNSNLDTVLFATHGEASLVSSSLVREIIKFGGDLKGLVPEAIIPFIKQKHY